VLCREAGSRDWTQWRVRNPFHAGSKVKGNGTRRVASGLRRDYRCTPNGDKPHGFAVVIGVEDEDEPVPVYLPPPPCPVHGKAARRARNGTYQRPGQPVRRQRYRCWPHTPDPDFPDGFHKFTPAAGAPDPLQCVRRHLDLYTPTHLAAVLRRP
jgi:hypothetical protein